MTEEDFQSKAHITKHMTGDQYKVHRERTRVNSWPELDWLEWEEFIGKTLGVDFYMIDTEIHMGLKISKDGLSREEDVEVLKGMYEEQRSFYGGLPVVSEAIMEQNENGRKRRKLKEMQ